MIISYTISDLSSRKFLAISGVILASVAFVMELTLLPMILTNIQDSFGIGITKLSWIVNSYAIAVALAVFTIGLLGDRVKKHFIFIVGVFIFFVGSILSSISESFGFLVFGRILQGLGGGLFSPLVPILLARAFPEAPGKILIIWGGLVGIVATVMPFIGGGLMWRFGWQVVFALISSVALISIVISAISLIEDPKEDHNFSIRYKKLLTIPSIWCLLSYIFFTYGCLSYFIFYFPVLLPDLGYSGGFLASFLAAMWISFSIASYALRNDVDGGHPKLLLLIAPIFFATGYVLGVSISGNGVALVVAAILVGIGFACCNAPSTHLLLKLAPDELHVFSASLDIVFARIGGVAAVALFSSALPLAAGGYAAAMAVLALISCYLCFAFIATRE